MKNTAFIVKMMILTVLLGVIANGLIQSYFEFRKDDIQKLDSKIENFDNLILHKTEQESLLLNQSKKIDSLKLRLSDKPTFDLFVGEEAIALRNSLNEYELRILKIDTKKSAINKAIEGLQAYSTQILISGNFENFIKWMNDIRVENSNISIDKFVAQIEDKKKSDWQSLVELTWYDSKEFSLNKIHTQRELQNIGYFKTKEIQNTKPNTKVHISIPTGYRLLGSVGHRGVQIKNENGETFWVKIDEDYQGWTLKSILKEKAVFYKNSIPWEVSW